MIATTIKDVEAYWNRQPCNVHHSDAPVNTREYFDEVDAKKYRVEPHILRFAEHKRWKDKRVLEVGCGIGTDAVRFAKAGARYTGVDLSEASVEIARKRFEVYGLKGRFFVADAEELTDTVPVRRYDLVYCWGMLHHTPDPKAVLKNIARYMDDLSELRLMVYAKHSWKDAMVEAGLDQYEAQGGCPLAMTYTAASLDKLLHHARLAITSWRQDHVFPYELSAYHEHRYVKLPWFEAMPPEVFRALESRLGGHLMARARLF